MRKKTIRKHKTKKRNKTKRKQTKRKHITKKRKEIKKKYTIKKQSKRKIVKLDSDYQNLRLRYLRAIKVNKLTKEQKKELSYLETLIRSLENKINK